MPGPILTTCNITFKHFANSGVQATYRIRAHNVSGIAISAARIAFAPWYAPQAIQSNSAALLRVPSYDYLGHLNPGETETITFELHKRVTTKPTKDGAIDCATTGVIFANGSTWTVTPGAALPLPYRPTGPL